MRRSCEWRTIICIAAFVACVWSGCATLQTKQPVAASLPSLPAKKQVRVHPYLFVTDVDLTEQHPLLKELEGLQDQVCRELELPPINDLVKVYLFHDRSRYEQYMQAHFRNLPPRRAFFMANTQEGRGDELVVYTYWGDRVQEDLRHELTHALLHGVLKNVPMWLDEGLAEYFEVPPSWHGVNYRHLKVLRNQRDTWTPNLTRLEEMTQIQEMNPADYRESWAWVHFLMKNPETRKALIGYLQQFRTEAKEEPLQPRLIAVCPSPANSLKQHLEQLDGSTRSLAGP